MTLEEGSLEKGLEQESDRSVGYKATSCFEQRTGKKEVCTVQLLKAIQNTHSSIADFVSGFTTSS